MDWDDAYANGAHIPGADDYPPRWQAAADAFRAERAGRMQALSYGDGPRQTLDLFLPDASPAGLAVFVHGGYWMRFDGRTWSHLARGALARGWAIALPSYTLCPDARIAEIVVEIGRAIGRAADAVAGPIRLAGHSAGGHLASRMFCDDAPVAAGVAVRFEHCLSISGLHDLRPLLRTAMNRTLGIDPAEARAESPALLTPREGASVTCWVGADERPELVRQNALLANIWTGLGARMRAVEDPGLHHFDVIDALEDADSPLVEAWLGKRGE